MRWQQYLTDFHRDRAGITEAVLDASHDPDGRTPYEWLVDAVPGRGQILDLACGNAALWPPLDSRRYIGLDRSASELHAAHRRGARTLVRASASALPLATSSIDIVTCSMALMVVDDLPAVLAEIRRVLRPTGRVVATVPTTGPLRPTDLAVLAGLLTTLGRRLRYPNDSQLAGLPTLLIDAGLRLAADESRRFGYKLTDAGFADRFLDSLYLPDLEPHRHRAARTYLRSLVGRNVELPIPIRRIQFSGRG